MYHRKMVGFTNDTNAQILYIYSYIMNITINILITIQQILHEIMNLVPFL